MGHQQHVFQLTVGTGSTSFIQFALHQKNGFRLTIIDHDSLRNYANPIYKNGIWGHDMVRLTLPLVP